MAIIEGNGAKALAFVDPHVGTAQRYENAALLANLMLLRAEALEMLGRADEARSARLDSLGWARYGFGAEWAMRARAREITVVGAKKTPNG